MGSHRARPTRAFSGRALREHRRSTDHPHALCSASKKGTWRSSHPSKLAYFTSLGMALVVVQLRTSSKHIPIVRAPGARDHASVIPSSPLESSF